MNTFFEILKEDHKKVKSLFSEVESGGSKEVFAKIEQELKVHMDAEEKFLYPVLEKHQQELKEKALESFEEHHVAKQSLKEITKLSPSDEHWKAKVSVLKEMIDHHIEEEEKQLFPMAKKALDKDTIQDITTKIQQAKTKAHGTV
jgi:iron-sulfur cluster repair protein YtfE (RIC family)